VTRRRIYVFVVLEVASRSVHLLGATTNSDGRWTTQQIRNLMMELGDRVTQFRFLLRDRAGQFTASFDAVLANVGIQVVRIPLRCPRRTVSLNGSSKPLEPNSPTASSSSISGICAQCSRNMFGTTTVAGPTAPVTFVHRNRPTLSKTSATNRSRADRYWA